MSADSSSHRMCSKRVSSSSISTPSADPYEDNGWSWTLRAFICTWIYTDLTPVQIREENGSTMSLLTLTKKPHTQMMRLCIQMVLRQVVRNTDMWYVWVGMCINIALYMCTLYCLCMCVWVCVCVSAVGSSMTDRQTDWLTGWWNSGGGGGGGGRWYISHHLANGLGDLFITIHHCSIIITIMTVMTILFIILIIIITISTVMAVIYLLLWPILRRWHTLLTLTVVWFKVPLCLLISSCPTSGPGKEAGWGAAPSTLHSLGWH